MLIIKRCIPLLRFLLLLSLVVILLQPLSVYAHSGDTDSSGGHYDHEYGGYHYHCGGHPAHQHTGGICPYRYSSSKPSGSSSGTSNSSTTTNKNNDDSDTGIVIFCTILFIALGLYVLYDTYKTPPSTKEKRKSIETKNDDVPQITKNEPNPQKTVTLIQIIRNCIQINQNPFK